MTLHERIDELTGSRVFLHDAFFAEALKFDGVLAEVIETITGRKLQVARVEVQETVDNRPYHSVRLDSTCYEQDGTIWNVEIENWSGDELMRRMRYYGDVLTARNFKPKRSYKKVPNVCVIFIVSFDYMGLGRVLYEPIRSLRAHTESERAENDRLADFITAKLDNGRYEYIVNASARDETAITKLVEELISQETVHGEMFPQICRMKDALLKTPEGEKRMTYCISEYEKKLANDNFERGVEEGIVKGVVKGVELERRTMSALKAQLLSEGKTDVFLRAVDDREYRDQLIEYYFPNGIPFQNKE